MKSEVYELDRKMSYVMSNFDFARVAEVMRLTQWKWVGVGIPAIYDMHQMVETLFLNIKSATDLTKNYSTACGGFELEWHSDSKSLCLRFSVTDTDSCYYNVNGDNGIP